MQLTSNPFIIEFEYYIYHEYIFDSYQLLFCCKLPIYSYSSSIRLAFADNRSSAIASTLMASII